MPYCAVIGCNHRSVKDSGISLYRLPTVIVNQGEKTEELSRRRRAQWLQNIGRSDIKESSYMYTRVCSDHFHSGKPSPLYSTGSPDWAPTLKLGHDRVNLATESHKAAHESYKDRRYRKRKAETEASTMPFSNLMPVPLPTNINVPVIPVDLGRVKVESEEPVPVGLYTSALKTNLQVSLNTPVSQPIVTSMSEMQASESNTDVLISKHIALLISQYDHKHARMIKPRTETQGAKSSVSCHPNTTELISNRQVSQVNLFPLANHAVKCDLKSDHSLYQSDTLIIREEPRNVLLKSEIGSKHPVTLSILGGISSQTDLTWADLCKMDTTAECASRNFKRMSKQLSCLHKRLLETDLSSETLADNAEKVKFYTGFANFSRLTTLYNYLDAHVDSVIQDELPKFQEFLMTLIILRLNVSYKDASQCYSRISESDVCKLFLNWTSVMDTYLQHVVLWPNREKLQEIVSKDFQQAYQNKIALIIDFLEVCVDERSDSFTETLVSTDHQGTTSLTFVLGITLNGVILFLSEAFEGNVSDLHLIHHCNILKNLLPGDFVFFESGLNGNKILCAEVESSKLPSINPSLSVVDMEGNQTLGHIRDCVRKVTGVVQINYQILQGVLSRHGGHVDKIVRLCCALTNVANNETLLNRS